MSFLQRIVSDFGGDILTHTWQHIYLTLLALLIASAIALPLGVYLAHCPWEPVVGSVLGFAGILQTIPSLAMIGIIVTVIALLHLPVQTVGLPPALGSLVAYALLPILRNTYTGIRQVDRNMIEVAKGMGMTRGQILWRVELPLSLPVIMAGIRIATVWTIGVACLVSLVGGGGLGDLIMRGLRSIRTDYIVAGTVPAALLAIVFERLLSLLESFLTPKGIQEED